MGLFQRILAVIRRELRIIRQRPVYIVGSVGVIAFCSIFFLSFLQKGLPDDIPIGIVDYDNTSTSRSFFQQLDATQIGKSVPYETFAQAREDMTRGKISAVCVLPKGLNSDIQASRQPKITFYINGLYFVGGSLAWKDLLQMVNLTSGAVQRQVLRMKGYNDAQIMGMIRPVDIDTHQIGNPDTNYSFLLSGMLIPAVIAMCVMMILIYSLGAELKFGTSRHLLMTSGGSIGVAVGGKVILWTVLFSLMGMLVLLLLYHQMGFPIAGSIWNMALNMFLLITSTEAVAILILEMIPIPRLALSIGALFSVLNMSLAGFTLPTEAMPRFIKAFESMFPLRHYYLFYSKEVVFGTGFPGWWKEAAAYLIFFFLPLLGIRRLKNAYINQNFPKD